MPCKRNIHLTVLVSKRKRKELDDLIKDLPFEISRNEFFNRLIDHVLDMELDELLTTVCKGEENAFRN